jgi:hypothetical protein
MIVWQKVNPVRNFGELQVIAGPNECGVEKPMKLAV